MPRRKQSLPDKIIGFLKDNPVADFFERNTDVKTVVIILLTIIVISWLGLFKLGPITLSNDNTLTVMGSYSTQEYNRVATFIATISDTSTDKDALIKAINERSVEMTEKVKEFGIDQIDIKTTNNYIYQVQDPEILRQYRGASPVWQAGTSVEIKVRDLNKVGDLTLLLTGFNNTEVFGPSYSLDEKDIDEAAMLSEAVNNAKNKARYLADAQNKKVGRIISIEELSGPTFDPFGGQVLGIASGGGSPEFSPGATKVTKVVKVTFKLLR